jgi:hypothetical protein
MCGRFLLTTSAQAVAEHFQLDEVPTLFPRYNIAPTQPIGVVRLAEDGPRPWRQWAEVRWGLVPAWAADASVATQLINARSETVADKPRSGQRSDAAAAWSQRTGLRVEAGRSPQAAARHPAGGRRALRLRRPVGALARLWRRGAGDGGRLHHRGQRGGPADPRPHAGDPAAGGLCRLARPQPARDRGTAAALVSWPAAETEAFAVETWVSDPRHEGERCLEREALLPSPEPADG